MYWRLTSSVEKSYQNSETFIALYHDYISRAKKQVNKLKTLHRITSPLGIILLYVSVFVYLCFGIDIGITSLRDILFCDFILFSIFVLFVVNYFRYKKHALLKQTYHP